MNALLNRTLKILTAAFLISACGQKYQHESNNKNAEIGSLKIQHLRTDGTNELSLKLWNLDNACVISNLGDIYCIPGNPVDGLEGEVGEGSAVGYDGILVPCILTAEQEVGNCEDLVGDDDSIVDPCPLREGEFICEPKPDPCVCRTEELTPCPAYYPVYCEEGQGERPPPLIL